VRGKATTKREKKSDENHRQGHDRETDVRDEQREVDVTNRARALKAHVAVEGVIGDVGDEEKGGKDKRREHGRPVLADALGADEAETGDEGDGREGVECRKEKQVGARNIGGCMMDLPSLGQSDNTPIRRHADAPMRRYGRNITTGKGVSQQILTDFAQLLPTLHGCWAPPNG
jgi:hypothetical protein